jgi:uncharacterized protein with HEPN domain
LTVPPTLGDRLSHIIQAIDDIQGLIAGRTRESIAADRQRHLALERLFEIVSEASRWIPADIRAAEAGIDWQRLADLGNILRHAYHRVDPARLFAIAENDLPQLRAFVERILQQENKR